MEKFRLRAGPCGCPLKKSSLVIGFITLVFGVLLFILSIAYMYLFTSPHHFVLRAENPVNLQAGFIISIIVSLILIHGVKNNNRFYFLPWVIWASLESIFTFSTLFFTIFVAANTEASAIVYVVIVLLVVVVALVYFLLLVLSYYLELRDQFYNQPENEPKPLDRIPA